MREREKLFRTCNKRYFLISDSEQYISLAVQKKGFWTREVVRERE